MSRFLSKTRWNVCPLAAVTYKRAKHMAPLGARSCDCCCCCCCNGKAAWSGGALPDIRRSHPESGITGDI